MRLLNTHTGRLKLFTTSPLPDYAILSHVWAKKEGEVPEQTFESVNAIQAHFPTSASILGHLSQKIQRACTVADGAGYDYIWVDTCCIDKSSSSELSEAINSTYAWYASAKVCFAYLADVHGVTTFPDSEWFKRVWTLQELIAPPTVVFLSRCWRSIGSKDELAPEIQEITKIDVEILMGNMPLSDVSVARRMSWAAERYATKREDNAYSLLGIFGVSLTLNYGEGDYAFTRFQEAIMTRIPDQTLFAWGPWPASVLSDDPKLSISRTVSGTHESCLLARSPKDFKDWSDVKVIPPGELEEKLRVKIPHPELTVTAYGVRASLPVVEISGIRLAILALTSPKEDTLTLILRKPHEPRGGKDLAVGFASDATGQMPAPTFQSPAQPSTRLAVLPKSFLEKVKVQDVYIRYDVAAGRHASRTSLHHSASSGVPITQNHAVAPVGVSVEISNPQQEYVVPLHPSQPLSQPFHTEQALPATPTPTPTPTPEAAAASGTRPSSALEQPTTLNGRTTVTPSNERASEIGSRWWQRGALAGVLRKLVDGTARAVGRRPPHALDPHEGARSAAVAEEQGRNEGGGKGPG